MPTNFELKRLKPKLNIVEKPENRVHKLTDSNVSRAEGLGAYTDAYNALKGRAEGLLRITNRRFS